MIEANQDEILSKVDLKDLNSKIKLMSLDGNHGFSGKSKKNLIKTVREIIL